MKYTQKIEWRIPKGFDLSDEVNLMAQAIVKDIKSGVRKGVDIKGSRFKALNPKYKRRKIAAGYPATILIRTGRMVGKGGLGGAKAGIGGTGVYLKKRATKSLQRALITVAQNRKDITVWHNEGAGKLPQREWFGVADRVKPELLKIFDKSLKKKLRA